MSNIGNDLEDRLKILEKENTSLRKYNDYHQVCMKLIICQTYIYDSTYLYDSSFYKQSMKIDNNHKIKEWIDYSIGQSTAIQELDKKRPTLSDVNQTQNRRRYINFENGSHFICSLNLNNPELTVFIVFKMTNIVSENQSFFNSLIGNNNEKVHNFLQNI